MEPTVGDVRDQEAIRSRTNESKSMTLGAYCAALALPEDKSN